MNASPHERTHGARPGCEGDAVKTLATIRRRKDTFTTVGKVITLFLDTKAALGGGSGP